MVVSLTSVTCSAYVGAIPSPEPRNCEISLTLGDDATAVVNFVISAK
jgi:hypothetical protein